MIRIVIAEDHAVVREGLKGLLQRESGFTVTAETGDGTEVDELVRSTQADALVVDLGLHGVDGLEAIRRTKLVCPETCVVVLSMHHDPKFVSSAIKAGAIGYVAKDDSFLELVKAVREGLQGRRYISSSMPQAVRDRVDQELDPDPFDDLTPRETEVFHLIAQGLSNRDIGERLYLSIRTIETHRASLIKKLGVRSHSALIRLAIQRGLVPESND